MTGESNHIASPIVAHEVWILGWDVHVGMSNVLVFGVRGAQRDLYDSFFRVSGQVHAVGDVGLLLDERLFFPHPCPSR